MDQRGAAYFQRQGFDVVSHARAPSTNGHWRRSPARPMPSSSGQRDAHHWRDPGLGRGVGETGAHEQQVVFWQALHLARIAARVERYGQLFDHPWPRA